MRPPQRRRSQGTRVARIASVVVAALTLAGCGSTVASSGVAGTAISGSTGLNGTPGLELGSPSVPPGVAPGGVLAPSTGGAVTTTDGTPISGTSTGGGSGTTATSTTPSLLPSTGQGYDRAKVYLGFPTNNDASAAAGSLGLAGLDFGDQIAMANAIVKDLNDRGGLFGRTVVALIHDIKTADLQADPQAQAQATCSFFTQDHKVVAVVNIVAGIDLESFYTCLRKHTTPLFTAGFVPKDSAVLRDYTPYLYPLTSPNFDTFGPVWISRLLARDYFSGWNAANATPAATPAKVGLLYADEVISKRIFAKIKADLVSRHIAIGAEFAYDASSLSAEGTAMSNAVLRFRSNGVTHVLAESPDVQVFMTAADSQSYRPRYGMSSFLAPQLQSGNTPNQLVGSIGLGWIPTVDVARAQNPGPVSSGETACRNLMKKAGVNLSSYGVELIAFPLCDGVHLLEAAAKTAASFAANDLRDALAKVGAGFPSALVFRGGISSSSTTLPGGGRDFAWKTTCKCYAYLDAVIHAW